MGAEKARKFFGQRFGGGGGWLLVGRGLLWRWGRFRPGWRFGKVVVIPVGGEVRGKGAVRSVNPRCGPCSGISHPSATKSSLISRSAAMFHRDGSRPRIWCGWSRRTCGVSWARSDTLAISRRWSVAARISFHSASVWPPSLRERPGAGGIRGGAGGHSLSLITSIGSANASAKRASASFSSCVFLLRVVKSA